MRQRFQSLCVCARLVLRGLLLLQRLRGACRGLLQHLWPPCCARCCFLLGLEAWGHRQESERQGVMDSGGRLGPGPAL